MIYQLNSVDIIHKTEVSLLHSIEGIIELFQLLQCFFLCFFVFIIIHHRSGEEKVSHNIIGNLPARSRFTLGENISIQHFQQPADV